MSTYKDLIKKKYTDLLVKVENIIDDKNKELLPKSIDDESINEILQYTEFLFPDDDTYFNLNELIEFKNIKDIDEKTKYLLIPIIDDFLKFLKVIKKYITK